MSKTRILGIDPGLNITGYGVLDIESDGRTSVVEAGVIRSKAKKPLPERLNSLHTGMIDVISSLTPDVIALEELYSHYERPRTSILMGHARGVICLAAAQNEKEVTHYAATQIKKILTGNGRAPKIQVQQAVTRHLNLDEIPQPADVADALAIAICHQFLGNKVTA